MIKRIDRNLEPEYVNILQLIYYFFVAEFFISMQYTKLYNVEYRDWNYRRCFWYCIALLFSSIFFWSILLASIKFLLI